jgi:hypothetical protein
MFCWRKLLGSIRVRGRCVGGCWGRGMCDCAQCGADGSALDNRCFENIYLRRLQGLEVKRVRRVASGRRRVWAADYAQRVAAKLGITALGRGARGPTP